MLQSIDAAKPPMAVIFDIEGEALTVAETAFFKDANPLGFILFARNCKDPVKIKALVQSLHALLNREVPVLIDQEGGRVQRLKPPLWQQHPAAADMGDKVADITSEIATELASLGINVDCAPVLDIRYPQTHDSLGNRAFSNDAKMVGKAAALACRAFLKHGVMPVMKHMPGLGRAHLDTHHDLPAVAASVEELKTSDYLPFQHVLKQNFAPALWGMVSHAVYSALDPVTAASCSRPVIDGAIRKSIGFDGLLLSDDVGMGALSQYGDVAARSVRVLESGCDIALPCNGGLASMKLVANRVPLMTNAAVVRYNRSIACMKELNV